MMHKNKEITECHHILGQSERSCIKGCFAFLWTCRLFGFRFLSNENEKSLLRRSKVCVCCNLFSGLKTCYLMSALLLFLQAADWLISHCPVCIIPQKRPSSSIIQTETFELKFLSLQTWFSLSKKASLNSIWK